MLVSPSFVRHDQTRSHLPVNSKARRLQRDINVLDAHESAVVRSDKQDYESRVFWRRILPVLATARIAGDGDRLRLRGTDRTLSVTAWPHQQKIFGKRCEFGRSQTSI